MNNTTIVYLASTLDLMMFNKQNKLVEEIVSKSTLCKLDNVVYMVLNKEEITQEYEN